MKDGSSVNDITYWFWTPQFKASPKGGVIKKQHKTHCTCYEGGLCC